MRRRGKHYRHLTLFISGTVSARIPLFRIWPEANEVFLSTLDFCRQKYGFLLRGYVIMPDHYHLLLTVKPGTSLPSLLRDFKSYVGKQVVQRLAETHRHDLLRRFRLARNPRRRKDARHRILQHDNDIVEVFSAHILRGKIQYMHANPVKKGLVERPDAWIYSSCRAYSFGEKHLIAVDTIPTDSL